MHCICESLLNPGDEVVTFEPFWPGFVNICKAAGGILKGVPLKANINRDKQTLEWEYDWDLLEETVSERTKMLLLINPQSPSGRVFSEEELEIIKNILDKKAPNALIL